jgi:hypothetical protein
VQVLITFGRIGRRGQARRHAFEDEAGLSSFVRHALLRRRSPTRRIGVSYEAVQASPSVLPVLAQLGLAIRPPPARRSQEWGLRAGSRSTASDLLMHRGAAALTRFAIGFLAVRRGHPPHYHALLDDVLTLRDLIDQLAVAVLPRGFGGIDPPYGM